MATFVPASGEAPSFKEAVCVIADVCRGNVGQLAVDVLIATLEMKRVGYFDDAAVLPAVGNEGTRMTVNVELYHSSAKNLFVLQQRSPAVPALAESWAARLAEWAGKAEFKFVLLLSSLPAELRSDDRLSEGGAQLTLECALAGREGRKRAEALGWDCVKGVGEEASSPEEAMEVEQVRGESTVTSRVMLERAASSGLDLVALLAWCNEGANMEDGMQMAGSVNRFLELLPANEAPKWRAPSSWRIMLENNAPKAIYN